LPEAILAATGGNEPAATPKPRTGVSFSNVLFTVWAKVAGALTMVFYAVRGIFLLLGQLVSRPAKSAPAPAPAVSRPAPPPVVHAGPTAGVATPAPAAAPTPGHPAVSAGPGVTKVITPAKATIVPPAPAAAPPAPPVPAPTEAIASAPAASEPPPAANGKKKAAPPVVGGQSGKDDKAIEAAPTASNEGRTKASGRRGIRLKLIKPGENDSGLK
jgi:hypothetical protein